MVSMHRSAALALLATLSPKASAQTVSGPECIDALVSAKITRQIPSVFAGCGDDCIVISWPWFVDLKVEHVLRGKAPLGRMTVQAVLHTPYRSNLGTRNWALRRNDLGEFNLIRTTDPKRLSLCTDSARLATPYIRPGEGKTLDDLIRESEQVYRENS